MMEFPFSRRRILSSLKRSLKKWLFVSVAALALTLALRFLFVTEKGVCSAAVNFSYAGLEAGLDPNGTRFEPMEMKSAQIVREAAEAIGETVTDEDVTRIQEALSVRGSIPDNEFERVVENRSIYGKNGLSAVTEIVDSAYVPSQYSIELKCKNAGFSYGQGKAFLTELLSAYERFFYESYGYNALIEEVFLAPDYEAYDYVDALEIMQSRLSSLRVYLTRLAQEDNARFVSTETGHSFSDLVSAIDTIQSEDAQWLNSYISHNNITKDKVTLINYYQYKIADARRTLEQQGSVLSTLNELIDSYQKNNAIVPGAAGATGAAEDGSVSFYEFTQPSEMYDSLINQKIAAQTSLSETEEQIALFQRRIERLQTDEVSGDAAIVEARLASIYEKIVQITDDLRLTADEFFRTVSLKRAFQVIQEPRMQKLILPTVRNSVRVLVMLEAAIFGLYILYALWDLRDGPEQKTPRKRSQREERTPNGR